MANDSALGRGEASQARHPSVAPIVVVRFANRGLGYEQLHNLKQRSPTSNSTSKRPARLVALFRLTRKAWETFSLGSFRIAFGNGCDRPSQSPFASFAVKQPPSQWGMLERFEGGAEPQLKICVHLFNLRINPAFRNLPPCSLCPLW